MAAVMKEKEKWKRMAQQAIRILSLIEPLLI